MAQYVELFRNWMPFGAHVLSNSSLPTREKEILILRIGYLCRARYEWAQHTRIGRRAGLTDTEIERIMDGADAPGWSEHDAALIRSVDELYVDAFISDKTWAMLGKTYNRSQLMDVVFTVGQYNLVSMALNTFGVQLDLGLDDHAAFKESRNARRQV
jgi:alkylhydroperoxidase family enzyme